MILFFSIIGLRFEVKSVSRKEQVSQMLNLFYCFHRTSLSIAGLPEPWVGADKWGANEPWETSLNLLQSWTKSGKVGGAFQNYSGSESPVCLYFAERVQRQNIGRLVTLRWDFLCQHSAAWSVGISKMAWTPKLNTVFGLILANKYHKRRMGVVGYAQDSALMRLRQKGHKATWAV